MARYSCLVLVLTACLESSSQMSGGSNAGDKADGSCPPDVACSFPGLGEYVVGKSVAGTSIIERVEVIGVDPVKLDGRFSFDVKDPVTEQVTRTLSWQFRATPNDFSLYQDREDPDCTLTFRGYQSTDIFGLEDWLDVKQIGSCTSALGGAIDLTATLGGSGIVH